MHELQNINNAYLPEKWPTINGKMADNSAQIIIFARKLSVSYGWQWWINVGSLNLSPKQKKLINSLPDSDCAYAYELTASEPFYVARLRNIFINEDGFYKIMDLN
jgi:hypothetical protein